MDAEWCQKSVGPLTQRTKDCHYYKMGALNTELEYINNFFKLAVKLIMIIIFLFVDSATDEQISLYLLKILS